MLKGLLPLALSFILTACAQTTISSPGKSDEAMRADMNSCSAGSLSLHDRPVIDCLNNHRDTITYVDGRIPPYTTGNPYPIPLTAAEVQARKAAGNAVLERWKAAAQNSTQNASVTAGIPTPVAAPSAAVSSGDQATTFSVATMDAELKEVLYPNGTQIYPHGVQGLSDHDIVRISEGIGNFFYLRNGNFSPGGRTWSVDKDIQDFAKARQWYQISLNSGVAGPNATGYLKSIDFQMSNAKGSARSEIAEEKNQDRIDAEERQQKLAARKKVGDCVVMSGGTGLLGIRATAATVTAVSGDSVSWVAHLHRNGYWYRGFGGANVWSSPQNFDREGSSKYNELSLCAQH